MVTGVTDGAPGNRGPEPDDHELSRLVAENARLRAALDAHREFCCGHCGDDEVEDALKEDQ